MGEWFYLPSGRVLRRFGVPVVLSHRHYGYGFEGTGRAELLLNQSVELAEVLVARLTSPSIFPVSIIQIIL